MTLVILRGSGYWCSSMAWLNSLVRVGAKKGVRSLMMVDFEDVAGFVSVDFAHDVGRLFGGDVPELEWWVRADGVLSDQLGVVWSGWSCVLL